MLGRLSLDAFPHDPIVWGAMVFIVCVAAAIVGSISYFGKFKWLWNEWLTSLDHKKIGVMYLIVAGVMLVRGLVDAGMMRAQQAIAVGEGSGYLAPDHFDQLFSAHGVIMIFFVAMPFLFGIINLVLPLHIGARDMAFPFLNAVSLWLLIASAVLMNVSLVFGEFATAGWLAYPPLSGIQYSPGVGMDYYIWILQISGIGTLLSGINFLTTIFTMRAPGMTLMRMPIFVWTVLGSMTLVVATFPILTATLGMLSLDRLLGMHFFTSDFGGNPMMYINLIWMWGHPEVYILVLPAFGIFSEVVANFSQKRLFGYASMVVATVGITFFSFVVWAHHFFTMGAGANVNAFFGIMTMVIAIPTGVKIFNWIFTLYGGRIDFKTPMLWFLGFVATFTFGGMTGVMLSIPAIDFQVHNSLFLVAHFHNTIIGGVVFGYFAGLIYWFPKFFGFTLHEGLGKAAFWSWIIGFFVSFTPLYILGFMGATRRLSHYNDPAWQPLFVVAAIGFCIIVLGVLFQVAQLVVSILKRKKLQSGNDPWYGRTLEWATSSPPPVYNFALIPHVFGKDPLWAAKHSNDLREHRPYTDIHLPKNTLLPVCVGLLSFLFGFGIVWHVWILAFFAAISIVTCFAIRALDTDTEYCISKEEVARIEEKNPSFAL